MAKTLHNSCLLPGIHFTMYTQGVSIRGYFSFWYQRDHYTSCWEKSPTKSNQPIVRIILSFTLNKSPTSFHFICFVFISFCSLKLLTVTTRSKEKELTRGNALLFSFCQLFPSTFARRICTANSKAIKAWNTPSQARRGSQIKFSIVFKMCYLIM